MVYWLRMRTHSTGVVTSNPPRVAINTPLARKATRNHLIKSPFLEKLRALSLISATLEFGHEAQFIKNYWEEKLSELSAGSAML